MFGLNINLTMELLSKINNTNNKRTEVRKITLLVISP